jgi:hypothetical protein
MSKRTRRKTLSHSEIDNFLCELNSEEAKDCNSYQEQGLFLSNDESYFEKNFQPPPSKDIKSIVRAIYKVYLCLNNEMQQINLSS